MWSAGKMPLSRSFVASGSWVGGAMALANRRVARLAVRLEEPDELLD
jgi:hypothetical protein